MEIRRFFSRAAVGAVLLSILAPAAFAQPVESADKYPSRTVRLIVPYAPGGQTDAYARLIALHLQTAWGQPVVVENRAGANGTIATQQVMRAAPDGYTLLFTANSAHSLGPLLANPPPFDPVADFSPVAVAVSYPMYVLVNPKVPARTVGEFAKYAKTKGDALAYSSAGMGSGGHLTCELFADALNVKLRHIPYKGSSPAQLALMTGEVDMFCDSVGSSQRLVNDGKMFGLVIAGPNRLAAAPNVPAANELGLNDVSVEVWLGLLGPKGVPAPIVAKLNTEIRALMRSAEVKKRTAAEGTEPADLDPNQFVQLVRADQQRYGKLIRDKQIKATD